MPSLFTLAQAELPAAFLDDLGIYYDMATTLGQTTAKMHLALASATTDPDFAPEPFTRQDRVELATQLQVHAASAFDTLKDHLARLPDDFIEKASFLLSLRRRILSRLVEVETLELQCDKIRIHGDYHLGQVLRLATDYRILDFEGEPARPLKDRLAKQSPLRDVAGMLRSFSYAAYAALFAHVDRWLEGGERLEILARRWELGASAAFLRAYRGTAGNASFLPADEHLFRRFLEIFLLEKGLYELNYEINNRPGWVRIPLWGILSLGWDANRDD
jgi:maltose alpha-D-glucosyltransferase/alpha-amylase